MRIFLLLVALLISSCATTHTFTGNAYKQIAHNGETIHLYTVDATKFAVRPVKADKLALLSDLAVSHSAIAAINGGFFQADGTPAGLLIIDHKVLGTQQKPRAALGWNKHDTQVLLDRLVFGRNKQFVSQTGSTTEEQWQEMDYVLGGTPLLIHDGVAQKDFSAEKVREEFLTRKHARTAICTLDNNDWILVVVEGGSSLTRAIPWFGASGMTMAELSSFMSDELKCKEALNLDGGGSSNMIIEGHAVSRTTFAERPISDALLVFERAL